MTNQDKRKGDGSKDGLLTALHKDVVLRLEAILDAVAIDFFEPRLDKQSETLSGKIDDQAKDIKKLLKGHKDRMDAIDQRFDKRFEIADEIFGGLSARNDITQEAFDQLNAEVHRLEALIRLQAEAATATETAFGRLNSRVIAARRVLWLLAAALAVGFYLIFKRY